MSDKKSTFKTVAKTVFFNKMKDISLPTERVDHRRLSVDDIKEYIKEEFGKAKEACDVEAEEPTRGWGDAEIQNQINWIKALKLKEFFVKDSDKKKG